MPERGFHHFSSPENDNDEERIAHFYVYCTEAVAEWPAFRRHAEEISILSSKQCDDIERNAIAVFREFLDTMNTAMATDNIALISQRRLIERLMLANSYLAIFADPTALAFYRREVCPQIDDLPPGRRPQTADFTKAVWSGEWLRDTKTSPCDVTRKETFRNSRLSHGDGVYNTTRRLDQVAKAQELLESLVPTGGPINKPSDDEILKKLSEAVGQDFLAPMKRAFTREATRQLFLRAGLKAQHATFGARMIHDDAKQKENPTAWRAIRRHRVDLAKEINKVLSA